MKNTMGNALSVTLFGESHGEAVGAVIDGLAPGILVDEKQIENGLARRRPQSATDTARREPDRFHIVSGVFEGKSTGSPLCLLIPNENTKSSDYSYGVARPSHADLPAHMKYHGFEDYRGGGHFSGRITAALVAVGGILIPALRRLGIEIGTHILECGGVFDRDFDRLKEDIALLEKASFPTLDMASGEKMIQAILSAKEKGDSIGGLTASAVTGLPAGLGEPWFDSVESLLSHALFSIGGIKGVDFGIGFSLTGKYGSALNDPIRMENGKAVTLSNHAGGIGGGITNGMPIRFRCAVKPTPSIAKPQQTVNFLKGENAELSVKGRHDPAIIRRICPVIDSVTAMVICDLIAMRFGTDALAKGLPL